MKKYYGIVFFVVVCILTGFNLTPKSKYKVGDCVQNGFYHFSITEVDRDSYTLSNEYIVVSDIHSQVERIFKKVNRDVCNR